MQIAKKLKKQLNITHDEALQHIAKANKFGNWKAVTHAYNAGQQLSTPTPEVSL